MRFLTRFGFWTLVAALFVAIVFLGCAEFQPYEGRYLAEPFIIHSEQRMLDPAALVYPRWIHISTGLVVNPTNGPLRVFVSCDVTTFSVWLPPRAQRNFIMTKDDRLCFVWYGVHLERSP